MLHQERFLEYASSASLSVGGSQHSRPIRLATTAALTSTTSCHLGHAGRDCPERSDLKTSSWSIEAQLVVELPHARMKAHCLTCSAHWQLIRLSFGPRLVVDTPLLRGGLRTTAVSETQSSRPGGYRCVVVPDRYQEMHNPPAAAAAVTCAPTIPPVHWQCRGALRLCVPSVMMIAFRSQWCEGEQRGVCGANIAQRNDGRM